jgi:hypothetical protein
MSGLSQPNPDKRKILSFLWSSAACFQAVFQLRQKPDNQRKILFTLW